MSKIEYLFYYVSQKTEKSTIISLKNIIINLKSIIINLKSIIIKLKSIIIKLKSKTNNNESYTIAQ